MDLTRWDTIPYNLIHGEGRPCVECCNQFYYMSDDETDFSDSFCGYCGSVFDWAEILPLFDISDLECVDSEDLFHLGWDPEDIPPSDTDIHLIHFPGDL